MAEGILKTIGDEFEVYSAGARSTFVHPEAIKVLGDVRIDILKQRSKKVKEFIGQKYDYVITLCGENAKDVCPAFAGEVKKRLHWNFRDPAEAEGEEKEALTVFREVRDQIKDKIEEFIKELKEEIS